jgi:DNA (cytosine-5)-methyltransferase 1
MRETITAGDFLAGGGGVTEALCNIPSVKTLWVLNHDQVAIRTNIFNHQGIKHYWSDLYRQDEHEMEPVDFVWASIECTQHSQAKGGGDKNIGSYTLGWELLRYIKYLSPFVIGIENVPEFKKWAPIDNTGKPDKKKIGQEFEKWKNSICSLGYDYDEKILNAADFGIPTRRIRYFAFFTRKELGMGINWPHPSHNKKAENNLPKWVACKDYINIQKEGESIFGRQFNENVRKGKRHPLSKNTLRRIAGGIKKFAPDLYFIMHYYSSGNQHQSINFPLNTIPTNDRHALIKLEKKQFVTDYCRADILDNIDSPVSPQLTWQTKQLITVDKKFLSKYFSGNQHHASSLDAPIHSITTIDHNTLITAKANFISKQYNSNGHPESNNSSIDNPVGTLTTQEKIQFISTYINSDNNPESQNSDIDSPLGSILTGTNKKSLITMIETGEFDFDIKMRFLEPEELSDISTFPKGYFTNPLLKLNKKEITKLIGNAVPPEWARIIIAPVIKDLSDILSQRKVAI